MGILSDTDIRYLLKENLLQISPLEDSQIQGASINLRLGENGQRLKGGKAILGQTKNETEIEYEDIFFSGDGYLMHPGEILVATTKETISIPATCNAKIFNRNNLLQMGIEISIGYINPGYKGKMPLTICNRGPVKITLLENLQICQMEISSLESIASYSYTEQREKNALSGNNPLSIFLRERIAELSHL